MTKYVAADWKLRAFTCPRCGTLARQYRWGYPKDHADQNRWREEDPHYLTQSCAIRISQCDACSQIAIWHEGAMVSPDRTTAPSPNPDMPSDVTADYEEAATILVKSPRAAAALLRLAIQKLCVGLGGKGKNINKDIGDLVSAGLPELIQKSLDVVRVTGNNAVHPGQIDVDSVDVATSLFPLVNVIVDHMISMPKRVGSLYESLPENAKKAIKERDGKTDGE